MSSDRQVKFKQFDIENKYFLRLAELYDLESCIWWIRNNKFKKVCLQFSETLIIDSVDVATYITNYIPNDEYTELCILGEGVKSRCCVDDVSVRSVRGDAIIHFGHSCLSPTTVPVYYVFFKRHMNIQRFLDQLEQLLLPLPIIILYDLGYYHRMDDLRDRVSERVWLRECVCIADIELPIQSSHNTVCSDWCSLRNKAKSQHNRSTLGRTFCVPEKGFQSLVYIGEASRPQNLQNFLQIFQDTKALHYSVKDGFKDVCRGCLSEQLSLQVDAIRSAFSVGIVVPELDSRDIKEGVEHVTYLCKNTRKLCYLICMGRPSPEKLSFFSEIDIFVLIFCPESDNINTENVQKIVGVYELDLALNRTPTWPESCSRDFRDIINYTPSRTLVNTNDERKLSSRNEEISEKRGSVVKNVNEEDDDSAISPITLSEENTISISNSSIVHLATAASMRAAQKLPAKQETTFRQTYNINRLFAQQQANRAAQTLVHQMKAVDKDDVVRMKAYQVTQKKPVRDPFSRNSISKERTKDFWASQNSKLRTTTTIERDPLSKDYSIRDEKIDKKLKEIETLSQEIAHLIESQENERDEILGREGTSKSPNLTYPDSETHLSEPGIPPDVLRQLTTSTANATQETDKQERKKEDRQARKKNHNNS